MKKKTMFILFFIVAGVLMYCFFTPRFFSAATSVHNDTFLVKQYCESAKMLRQNNPDSAIIEYQKAIQLLESIPENDRIKHLLATTYLDLSSIFISKGDYDQQKDYARKGLSIAGRNNNEINALGFLYEGLVNYNQGELDSALFLYEKADSLAKLTGAKSLEAKILSNIAIISSIRGNHEKAIDDFSKTKTIGIELNDEELINASYVNLGIIYTQTRDFEKAKEVYTKAIDYYSKNNLDMDLANCLKNLGNVYFWQEKNSEALDFYQQSLALAIKIGNKREMAKAYNNIGEIYRIIGDQDQALEMFYNSLKIKEEISDKAGTAVTHRALANIYFNQKNYAKSLEYFQSALKTDSTLNLVDNMAIGYANISTLYKEFKKDKEAIEYGLKSIELFKQVGNVWGESESYQLLGAVYQDQKEYDVALEYYQKSLAQKLELSSDGLGLAGAYLMLSDFYLNKPGATLQDINHAERYGLSAYHIVDSLKLPYWISKSSEILAQVFERQQNLRQAVQFMKINKQANDSLFNQSKAEALVFAEARWNDEKRQGQIRYLEKENQSILAQKEEQHKRHQLVFYGLIIIFAFIALTAILLWMYKRKQHEIWLQQQLAHIAMLRYQNIQNRISPHFMFNVLNAVIPALWQHEELSRPLQLLVQSIRGNLQASDKIAIPLEDEIAIVKNFIELHESIHPGSIQIRWDIENEVDRQVLLPSMMLQIPVENAVKYAFEDDKNDKFVTIKMTQNTQSVNIAIEDNGIGFNPGKHSGDTRSTGNGLKILYKTVELLNTKNQHPLKFDILNLGELSGLSGTKVHISIPLDYKYSV